MRVEFRRLLFWGLLACLWVTRVPAAPPWLSSDNNIAALGDTASGVDAMLTPGSSDLAAVQADDMLVSESVQVLPGPADDQGSDDQGSSDSERSDGCPEEGCCYPQLLFGIAAPSDHCFDDFISPMTNPVFFEDPRNVTEARLMFLNHKVPLAAGGGDVQLYAVQIRAALTERLSLLATKDGYMVSENSVVGDGWADISAGLKYLLFSDPATQQLASAGAVYDIPLGTPDSQQGNGDGTFDLFLTGGSQIGCRGHWIGAGGFVLPTDDEANSTWCYVSNHFDYEFHPGVYALTEFNWYHWLESGSGGVPGIEGGDLFNFGSTGVAGNDIVTGAFGLKYKASGHTELGIAWEVPLTERRDVLENRLTLDWIFRY